MIETEEHGEDKNTTRSHPQKKTTAVIFGIGLQENLQPLLNCKPSLLLNIADKAIIIHIIEHLIQNDIHTFDVILHHFPEQIEEKLGDGSRWGIKIRYHLAKNPEHPFSAIISTIKNFENDNVLIGIGDSLPIMPSFNSNNTNPLFYNYPSQKWSGWALLTVDDIKKIPTKTPYGSFPELFNNRSSLSVVPFLDATGFYELKESNKRFLNEENTTILAPTEARKIEPGVWISRAVVIEPGVEITPPVFIGEHTHIRSGASIGPHVIIENCCIIDNNSTIEDSLICQKSYVGENLEIINCIVDRNALINLTLDTHLHIEDNFLISESTPPPFLRSLKTLFEKELALILFVILSPLYVLMRLFYPLRCEKKLCIPCDIDPDSWKTFNLYSFGKTKHFKRLPELINIIKGELSFVGTTPRSIDETKLLPDEWRKLYLKTKPGFITLTEINHGKKATDDEKYASEAFYATQSSLMFDFNLIIRWILTP